VQLLDEDHRYLLGIMCQFLNKVTIYQEQNKMTAGNLAIVFAPTILRPKDDSAEVVIGDAIFCYGLMESLIDAYQYFFGDMLADLKTESKAERLKKHMEDKYAKLKVKADGPNNKVQPQALRKTEAFKKKMTLRYTTMRRQSVDTLKETQMKCDLSERDFKLHLRSLKDKILDGTMDTVLVTQPNEPKKVPQIQWPTAQELAEAASPRNRNPRGNSNEFKSDLSPSPLPPTPNLTSGAPKRPVPPIPGSHTVSPPKREMTDLIIFKEFLTDLTMKQNHPNR